MLLQQTAYTAKFKAGKSPLGHHWELADPEGNALGETKREYSGGAVKRALWRSVTATGMDSGNDIKAVVLDADGAEVAHLFSRNDQDGLRVEVSAPGGAALGVVHHDATAETGGFELKDASGQLVARIPVPGPQDPWEVIDAAGERIGLVTRQEAKRAAGAALLDYVASIITQTGGAQDFQNTMHLGFASSDTYSVMLNAPPASPLIALTPVILAYAY